jgi:hypothetical protein
MATLRIPVPEQTITDFKSKCAGWLRRARQQKALAKAMVKRMHEMRARAVEMRKPPNPAALLWRADVV